MYGLLRRTAGNQNERERKEDDYWNTHTRTMGECHEFLFKFFGFD
jgi:hypothetical protein